MSEDSRDKLKGSPFTTMEEWKKARARCKAQIWNEIMPAIVMEEDVLQNPAVANLVEKYWKKPWSGGPGGDLEGDELVSFFIGDAGVPNFRVSPKLLEMCKDQNVIEGLVRAGFSVFTDKWMLFMRLDGRYMPSNNAEDRTSKGALKNTDKIKTKE